MPAPIRRVDKDGFPIATTSFEELAPQTVDPGFPTPARNTNARSWIWRWRWWLLTLLLVVLFGIPLVNGGRHLVAQWLLRQAEEHEMHGNLPAAAANADRALDWEPNRFDRWEAYQCRALVREEMQKLPESAADWDEVIDILAPEAESPKVSGDLCEAYRQRAWVEERLEKHRAAIDDATLAVDIAPAGTRDEVLALNNRAYVRALAGLELEQGLQDIQRALKITPNEADFIDTRGVLYLRLGQHDAALADLNTAIADAERHKEANTRVLNFGWGGPPFGDRADDDGRELSAELTRLNQALAVMHHHRGEVYEKLQQHEKAAAEFHLANRMGYDPKKGIY